VAVGLLYPVFENFISPVIATMALPFIGVIANASCFRPTQL
jgi:hypothetical protein